MLLKCDELSEERSRMYNQLANLFASEEKNRRNEGKRVSRAAGAVTARRRRVRREVRTIKELLSKCNEANMCAVAAIVNSYISKVL